MAVFVPAFTASPGGVFIPDGAFPSRFLGGAAAVLVAPTLVGWGSPQAAAGSLTYDLATGSPSTVLSLAQDGDVLFGVFETANETPGSTPVGWTWLSVGAGVGTPGDAAATALHAAWARVSGTPGNPSFGDAGDHTFGRVLLIRGCRTGAAPVVVLAAAADSRSEPVPWPSASTTIDQCLVVHAIAHGEDVGSDFTNGFSGADLAGGAEAFGQGTSLGNGGGLAAYAGVQEAAGPLGAVTVGLQNVTQPLNLARATFAFIPEGA